MRRTALALLSLLLLAACTREPATPHEATHAAGTESIPFRPDGTLDFVRDGSVLGSVRIEVAATDSARERGLMQRAPLTDEQAMLFVFDFAAPQTFWMANTPASLDIIFAGADSAVLNVAKYTRPFSVDGVSSVGPARYVLEAPAGFADRHDIAPGDRLRWSLAGE